jgi:hypothetical protein
MERCVMIILAHKHKMWQYTRAVASALYINYVRQNNIIYLWSSSTKIWLYFYPKISLYLFV